MENNNIEVVYVGAVKQEIISLRLSQNATVQDAIQQSQILNYFPEIDLQKNKIGIFGKFVELNTLLQDGDRVEIYRSLVMEPKQARRLRAARQKRKY